MTEREQVTPTSVATEPAAVERTTLRSFSPGRIIAALLGAFLVLVGALALFSTGVDSDVTKPLTTVFGITQSAGVGMVEIAIGLLLIAGGSAVVAGVVAVLAIGLGIPMAFASLKLQLDFGFGQSTGRFFVVMGFIALLAALLPVVWDRKRVRAAPREQGAALG
jgi:hypothetical protein